MCIVVLYFEGTDFITCGGKYHFPVPSLGIAARVATGPHTMASGPAFVTGVLYTVTFLEPVKDVAKQPLV